MLCIHNIHIFFSTEANGTFCTEGNSNVQPSFISAQATHIPATAHKLLDSKITDYGDTMEFDKYSIGAPEILNQLIMYDYHMLDDDCYNSSDTNQVL